MLVVIQSGSDNPYKVGWGLRMALNAYTHPYGEKFLDDVKVLLFPLGVTLVNPKMPFYDDFKKRLQALKKARVEVAACVSIARELGLEEDVEALGIKLVHASIYVSRRVS